MLWPFFEDRILSLISNAKNIGLTVDIHSGFRDKDKQNLLYSLGRTVKNTDGVTTEKPLGNVVTNARAGQSWHNFGVAADIVFKDDKGAWSWSSDHPWAMLGRIGTELGLEWGGQWSRFQDLPHFQLTGGMTLGQAQQFTDFQTLWDAISKRLS